MEAERLVGSHHPRPGGGRRPARPPRNAPRVEVLMAKVRHDCNRRRPPRHQGRRGTAFAWHGRICRAPHGPLDQERAGGAQGAGARLSRAGLRKVIPGQTWHKSSYCLTWNCAQRGPCSRTPQGTSICDALLSQGINDRARLREVLRLHHVPRGGARRFHFAGRRRGKGRRSARQGLGPGAELAPVLPGAGRRTRI